MAKKLRIYLWFSSFDSGGHCNTISYNASDIAREMITMEENLGEVSIQKVFEMPLKSSERMLMIFDEINKLQDKEGKYEAWFEFADGSWSTITLLDSISVENVKRIIKEAQQIKKKVRIHKKVTTNNKTKK